MQSSTISRSRLATKRTGPLVPLPLPAAPSGELQARAGEAAALLKALANPDRLVLLCQLVDGERSVSQLGALTGIEQPSLSQQLGVLRGERLVATRREGKQVIYRIASPAAMTVLEALYRLFCDPARTPSLAKPVRAAASTASRTGRKTA